MFINFNNKMKKNVLKIKSEKFKKEIFGLFLKLKFIFQEFYEIFDVHQDFLTPYCPYFKLYYDFNKKK